MATLAKDSSNLHPLQHFTHTKEQLGRLFESLPVTEFYKLTLFLMQRCIEMTDEEQTDDPLIKQGLRRCKELLHKPLHEDELPTKTLIAASIAAGVVHLFQNRESEIAVASRHVDPMMQVILEQTGAEYARLSDEWRTGYKKCMEGDLVGAWEVVASSVIERSSLSKYSFEEIIADFEHERRISIC